MHKHTAQHRELELQIVSRAKGRWLVCVSLRFGITHTRVRSFEMTSPVLDSRRKSRTVKKELKCYALPSAFDCLLVNKPEEISIQGLLTLRVLFHMYFM